MSLPFVYRECADCHGINCHRKSCAHYQSKTMNVIIKIENVEFGREPTSLEEATKLIHDRVTDALITHNPVFRTTKGQSTWIQRFSTEVQFEQLEPELEFLEGAIDRLKKLDAPTRARALDYLVKRFGGK